MGNNNNHGGRRTGAGRPANDRNVMISVRVSKEAADKLATVKNKSEFIDNIIKQTL